MTFTEYKTVEKEIIDCLTGEHLRWRYEPGDQVTAAYRGGDEQEMLLIPILRTKLRELNPGVITTDERADLIIQRLRALNDNQEWLRWLRGEKTYKFAQDEQYEHIHLIDYREPDRNDFLATNQVWIQGIERRRPDVLLYVNGIPVVDIEAKTASHGHVDWAEGAKQTGRYDREIPNLYHSNCFCVGVNELRMKYGVPGERLQYWQQWPGNCGGCWRRRGAEQHKKGKIMDKDLVMYNSDQAAVYETRTLTGWWSVKSTINRQSNFWGESEHFARWDGCTHRVCKECGENIHPKHWTRCKKCREKDKKERFDLLPVVDWDGETPICTFEWDRFFFNQDELDDYCYDNNCTPNDLMLVICDPVYPRLVHDDYWCEDLPEDTDLPTEIRDALDEFNKKLQDYGVFSWTTGKKRVRLEEERRRNEKP